MSHRSGSPGFDTFLASIATTMHWSPNFSAASLTKARSFTAAVLIDTLSAPDCSRARMSATVRTPPPTVSGMKQASAVRRTTSRMMPRFSWLAVMSRQGMTRTFSIAPSLRPRGADQPQRLAGIEPAVIEGAAGNGAGQLGGAGRQQLPDIVEGGEAARRDHRYRYGVGQ